MFGGRMSRAVGVVVGVGVGVGMILCAIPPVARAQARVVAFEPTLSQTIFGPADGLPAVPIYQAMASREGTLWLATGAGPYAYDGRQWRQLELPDSVEPRSVRAMAQTADGSFWFGTLAGILRWRNTQWTLYSTREGVPRTPIYSMLVSSERGEETLIAATDSGLRRFDGQRFTPFTGPPLDSAGLMISASSNPGQFWMASLRTGVALYDRGSWHAWNLAEPTPTFVNQVVATPPGDSIEALAAVGRGVMALRDGKWRLFFHTSASATRVLRVKVGDRVETWLGTENGLLLRNSVGSRWDTLSVGGRQSRSAVQVLTAMDHGLGGAPTIYVGYRSGYFVRFRIGPASTLPLPRDVARGTMVSMLSLADGSLLASVNGVGTAHVSAGPRIVIHQGPQTLRRFTSLTWDGRPETWALDVDSRSLVRWDGGTWRSASALLPDTDATFISNGIGPDGTASAITASDSRLWYRRDRRWARWDGAPPGDVLAVAEDTTPGARALWLLHANDVWRYANGRWESFGRADGLPNAPMTALRLQRQSSGQRVIWIGSLGAGTALAYLNGQRPRWHSLTANVTPGLLSDDVGDVLVAPHDRVFLATSRGVIRLHAGISGRPADDPIVEDSYTDRDGLPHPHALTLALSADQQRVWIGTLEGIASVPVDAALPVSRDERLTVTVRHMFNGEAPLTDNEVLSHDAADVEVVANYPTYHRESDSRFRFQLVGDDGPGAGLAWQELNSMALRSLGTGDYRLRVWAHDWRGDAVGPVEVRWRVAPPPWTSPWALLSYTVLLGGLLAMTYRRRVRSLRRRAQELRANERRLAASEARFRSLFDSSGDAQFLIDQGRIVASNPAAATLLGFDESLASQGMLVHDLVPDLSDIPIRMAGAIVPASTSEAIARSGERIPVAVRRTRIESDQAELEHVRLRDLRVTRQLERERAQLEDQLRRSQRLESLGTLAGGVAHDFNNLLAIIRANADLSRMDLSDREAVDEALEAIQNASDRGRDLVRQILTFSRRRASARQPVSMRRLLAEIRPMLRASIPTTVSLVIDDRASSDVVLGDATQLHQMLLNLAANAEYAMRDLPRGELTITLRTVDYPGDAILDHGAALPGRYVCVAMTDTGTGMSADTAVRVFEPFFTTKPVGEGTGLGLAVLHGIVASHAGSVAFRSRVGQGTTFEILLPAHVPAGPPVSFAPPSAVGGSERPMYSGRVLIVDDEPELASITARILVRHGYHVTIADSTADALALLEARAAFDLMLSDQTMPIMSGDVLCQHARALRPDLTVVIMTGYSHRLTPERIVECGCAGVLEKPFHSTDLVNAVQRALANRKRALQTSR